MTKGRRALQLVGAAAFLTALLGGAGAQSARTVTVWSWFVQSTMQKVIDEFQKANPGVTVKYTYYNYSPQYLTALKAGAASNSLPDVIGLQPGSLTQQYRPYLAPLDPLAAKTWGAGWKNAIAPVNQRQMLMGNPAGDKNSYILPAASQVLCIWYNVPLFKQLNLSVPKTYADLVSVSKKLTAGGFLPVFQGAADGWQNENVFLMLANQLSSGITDRAQAGTVAWTNPTLVKAMDDWKALFTDGVFQEGALGAHAYPDGVQLFRQGRVGMMALGSWWMQESKFPPPLSPLVENMSGFDYFYFPALPGSTKASPPVGGVDIGYGLTKTGAKNPDAWTFLASLTRGEGLQATLNDLNDLASVSGVRPGGDISAHVYSMYDRFMADLPKAVNQRFAAPEVADALDNALAGVAAGKLSSMDALASVQAASDKVLKK